MNNCMYAPIQLHLQWWSLWETSHNSRSLLRANNWGDAIVYLLLTTLKLSHHKEATEPMDNFSGMPHHMPQYVHVSKMAFALVVTPSWALKIAHWPWRIDRVWAEKRLHSGHRMGLENILYFWIWSKRSKRPCI